MVSTPVGILYKVACSLLSAQHCNEIIHLMYARATTIQVKVSSITLTYDVLCSSPAAGAIFEQLQAAPQNDST